MNPVSLNENRWNRNKRIHFTIYLFEIYINWNYWNWKIYINHKIINKIEEKKISHVKYDNQVFFSVFFSYLNSQSHDEVFFYDK